MSVERRLAEVEDKQRNLRNADRLQGRRVSAAAPSGLNFLGFNADKGIWEPKAGVLDADLDQADVAESTAEETLYTYTIPADTLGATGGFRMHVDGDMLDNVAGTLTLKVKLGSTTVYSRAGIDPTNSAARYAWVMEAICINSATNAQQWSFRLGGVIGVVLGSSADAIHGIDIGTSTEDTTTDLALTMTAQWSASNASLSCRKETGITERLGLSAGTGAGGLSAHNILDGGTGHSDSASDSVTKGSIIIGNATPAWDELVVGADGEVLTAQADGTVDWEAAGGGGGQDLATDTLWAAQGDLVKGTGDDAADILSIGADHTVLVSDGSDPSWSAAPPLANIADTGDTNRITLSTSSPELSFTGDVDISGLMAIGNAASVSALSVITVDHDHTGTFIQALRALNLIVDETGTAANVGSLVALAGVAQNKHSAGNVIALTGLQFAVNHATTDTGVTTALRGIQAQAISASTAGSITNEITGILLLVGATAPNVPAPVHTGVYSSVVTRGTTQYHFRGAGMSGGTNQYGLHVADISDGDVARLLELGGGPELRLLGLGEWTPAANETPLRLAEGSTPTLREVKSTDMAFLSIATTEDSAGITIEKDIFHDDQYTGTLDFESHVTAKNITFTSSNGRFTADVAGIYLIVINIVASSTVTQTDVTVAVQDGGADFYSHDLGKVYATTVAPVVKTVSVIRALSAADYINVTILPDTGTLTILDGTTMVMTKIADITEDKVVIFKN